MVAARPSRPPGCPAATPARAGPPIPLPQA
jgi:hypothetical protein